MMNWENIWQTIKNFFTNNAGNIIYFFAVLFLGIIVIKLILNITKRILYKTAMEKIAVGFIVAIIKFLLYLCLVIWLLTIVGINVNGIITALSAAFLSIGLALQNTIANIANGIIIVSSKMFKKGDFIKVGEIEGSIMQINFLYTTLITPDNKRVTLPNDKILNDVVINYDSNNIRRVNLTFEVAMENDVEQVKQIVITSMLSNGLVLLDPAPFCRLNKIDGANLCFTARCWCDREDYWTVYFDVTETVFNELKRAQVKIAYPQIEMRQRFDHPQIPVDGEGLPERVEKVRKQHWHFDLENAGLNDIFAVRSRPGKKNKKQKAKTNPKTLTPDPNK